MMPKEAVARLMTRLANQRMLIRWALMVGWNVEVVLVFCWGAVEFRKVLVTTNELVCTAICWRRETTVFIGSCCRV